MFSQLVNPPGRHQIVSKGQMKRYIRAVRDSNFIALLLQQAGIHASHVHLCHANSVLLPQHRILACDSGLPLQTRFDGGRLGITNRTRQLSPIECVHDQRAGAHCGLNHCELRHSGKSTRKNLFRTKKYAFDVCAVEFW